MGVFGDWAERYWDHGLSVIYLDGKKALITGWTDYCRDLPDEVTRASWLKTHSKNNLGLCLGPASNLIAIDVDSDDPEILTAVEQCLPLSPCKKRGAKGFTAFYLFNPDISSHAIKCKGLNVIDVLADGRQTVMPPSIHPETNEPYKFLSTDLLECLDDLPILHASYLKTLAEALERIGKKQPLEKFDSAPEGRNDALKKELGRVFDKMPPAVAVEHLVSFDKANHSSRLFCDQSEGGDPKNPYKKAWEFYVSIAKTISKNQTSNNSNDETDFYKFFDEGLALKNPHSPRKDILTKNIFYRHPSENRWASGEELLPIFKSSARKFGLKKMDVADEFQKYQLEKTELSFLVDLPEWDGADRVKAFTECIQSQEFEAQEIYEIVLHWGAGVFRRIYNSEEQNECLILKGPQGIGKDFWVRSLIGGFGQYYANLDIEKIDELIPKVQRIFIAHLEEFDQTKKIDVAELKALITKPSSYFREKYGRVATQKEMRCSWISTVNVDDFLRDSTGSRRFIILPIHMIIRDYPISDSLLILAQFKAKMRYRMSDAVRKKVFDYMQTKTPDGADVTIKEAIMLEIKKHLGQQERVPTVELRENFYNLARQFGVHPRSIYRAGQQFRVIVNGRHFYAKCRLDDFEKAIG